MTRYRIVTDGLTFCVQGEVEHRFLWWRWTGWYDCTGIHSDYFYSTLPLGRPIDRYPQSSNYETREEAEEGFKVLKQHAQAREDREAKRHPWCTVREDPKPREDQTLDEFMDEKRAEMVTLEEEFLKAAEEAKQ